MGEVISIIVSVHNSNSSILKLYESIIIDSGSSIDISFENYSCVYSPLVCMDYSIYRILLRPCIDFYPDSLLSGIKGTNYVFYLIAIWQENDLCM